jgi:hypothetical protein
MRRRNLYLRAFEPRFKFHFRVTAGRSGGYGGGYNRGSALNESSLIDNENGDYSTGFLSVGKKEGRRPPSSLIKPDSSRSILAN